MHLLVKKILRRHHIPWMTLVLSRSFFTHAKKNRVAFTRQLPTHTFSTPIFWHDRNQLCPKEVLRFHFYPNQRLQVYHAFFTTEMHVDRSLQFIMHNFPVHRVYSFREKLDRLSVPLQPHPSTLLSWMTIPEAALISIFSRSAYFSLKRRNFVLIPHVYVRMRVYDDFEICSERNSSGDFDDLPRSRMKSDLKLFNSLLL